MQGKIEEGSWFWTFLNRRGLHTAGIGKWKIKTTDPKSVYNTIRERIYGHEMGFVSGIKMRTYPEKELETVYVYTGPYTELAIVQSVAIDLVTMLAEQQIPAEYLIEYKTDLQTFWQKESGMINDKTGMPEQWQGKWWLYSYEGNEFRQNEEMLQMHYEIEKCGKSTNSYFNELYIMAPKYLLSGVCSPS